MQRRTICFIPDLVEIAGPPDRSDLICVVEEPDAGLSQAVTLSDCDRAEALGKLLPNICPETTSCCQPDPVSSLLWNLEGEGAAFNSVKEQSYMLANILMYSSVHAQNANVFMPRNIQVLVHWTYSLEKVGRHSKSFISLNPPLQIFVVIWGRWWSRHDISVVGLRKKLWRNFQQDDHDCGSDRRISSVKDAWKHKRNDETKAKLFALKSKCNVWKKPDTSITIANSINITTF